MNEGTLWFSFRSAATWMPLPTRTSIVCIGSRMSGTEICQVGIDRWWWTHRTARRWPLQPSSTSMNFCRWFSACAMSQWFPTDAAVLGEYVNLSFFIYLDDVIVFSADVPSHLQHLEQVFVRLAEHSCNFRGARMWSGTWGTSGASREKADMFVWRLDFLPACLALDAFDLAEMQLLRGRVEKSSHFCPTKFIV